MDEPTHIIHLVGGPLDGIMHEMIGGLMPARVCLLNPDNLADKKKHWYKLISHDTAVYDCPLT